MTKVTVTVNGSVSTIEVETRTLLADALRDELGLTGTHIGCDTSQCGCCTVRMDGSAVKSCTLLAVQAEGSQIDTIEGLAETQASSTGQASGTGDERSIRLHPVQRAFSNCHALQCGFCTPGMIMAAVELLDQNPDPTDQQIREGLSGNLCRCTGYVNIENAVKEAAASIRGDRMARGRTSTDHTSTANTSTANTSIARPANARSTVASDSPSRGRR